MDNIGSVTCIECKRRNELRDYERVFLNVRLSIRNRISWVGYCHLTLFLSIPQVVVAFSNGETLKT